MSAARSVMAAGCRGTPSNSARPASTKHAALTATPRLSTALVRRRGAVTRSGLPSGARRTPGRP